MQDILYSNGDGEDTGDGTSVVVAASDLFTVDGVHPTSTGYKFIANVIIPMIRV